MTPRRTFVSTTRGVDPWHCLAQVAESAHQTLDADGVSGADRDHGVGSQQRGQGRAVASWRSRVERQLFVLLEGEPAVHDGERSQAAGQRPDGLQRRRAQLGPPLGARDAGEHPQVRGGGRGDASERGEVELTEVGQPGRGGQARCLVEKPEHLRHGPAIGVRIGQQSGHARQRELPGDAHRHRRAARCTGRAPHGDQPSAAGLDQRRNPPSAVRRSPDRPGRRPGRRSSATRRPRRRRSSAGASARASAAATAAAISCGALSAGSTCSRPSRRSRRLGDVVTGREQADDRHLRQCQPGERVPVEPTQVCRHERRPTGAGGGSGQEVGEVDTPPYDRNAVPTALQRRDHRGLPARAGDGGEQRHGHGEPALAGDPFAAPLGTCAT